MDKSLHFLVLALGVIASADSSAGLVPAASEFINHQRWTVRDGLLQQTVTDVIEARDGYLWVTTYGGLTRFDGVRFSNYEVDDTPQLGTNKLVSLFEDDQEQLWIGTVDGGIVRADQRGFTHFDTGTPDGDVQDFEQTGGVLWAAGGGISKLVSRDGQPVWERETSPEWLPEARVGDLLATPDGVLWAATERGLLRNSGEGFELVDGGPAARDARGLALDDTGRLWLAAHHGLGYFDGRRVNPVHALRETVYSAVMDANGTLFVGAVSGLYGFDTANPTAAPERIHLPHDDESLGSGVTALRLDRAGELWVGTNTFGLIRISRVPFSQFEDPRGLQYGSVLHLAADKQGGVWLQGQDGWFVYAKDGSFARLDAPSQLSVPASATLLGVAGGAAWFADAGSTYRLQGSVDDGFNADVFEVGASGGVVEAADGRLWFGGDAGLQVFDGNRFEPRPLSGVEGRLHPRLQAIDGSIWFTGTGLVGRVFSTAGETGFELIGEDNPWLDSELRSLYQDASGTLWLSTYGKGLVRIRDGVLARIGRSEGLSELSLGGILEDDAGRLWINSNRGVMVIPVRIANNAVAGRDEMVPRFLGSPETNGPGAAVDDRGKMWFPTVRGLVVADPRELGPESLPPTVHVEQVILDNHPLQVVSPLHVPSGIQDITVEYTGISLREPERVQFRYRLAGYQDEWVDAGNRRTAFFTKVPPGTYDFQLAAVNGDGISRQLDQPIRFEVAAKFYQTTWFRIVAALLLLLLFFALHRLRLASLERNARALRAEIENRKKAERERALMERSLMESSRLEAVGRLAGGIAHDFNNVLTAVLGHAEQAQNKLREGDADSDAHLEGIIECSERAAALTRQLLAFSRRQVLMPRLVDMRSIIGDLLPMLKQLLPESIELTWTPPLQLPQVRVDPSQLEQVVMNLVLNARDALPDGGEIVLGVSCRNVTDEMLQPGPGEYVEITVRDNGVGMDPEVLARVFDPFFTTKTKGKGTGLGLASVHGIVVQSGGHIEVESRPQSGTTFTVMLPVQLSVPAARPVNIEPVPTPTTNLNGTEHVLLCEDDDASRAAIVSTLRSHGYEVSATATPGEALALTAHGRPVDLLVTDMVLPGMSGMQLARRVLQRCPTACLLFISGHRDGSVGKDLPADAVFLAKPFKPSDLLSVVRRQLDPRKKRRQSA